MMIARIGGILVAFALPARAHVDNRPSVARPLTQPGEFTAGIFGGPDGKTAYLTEVEDTRLDTFRADAPGLAWKRLQAK